MPGSDRSFGDCLAELWHQYIHVFSCLLGLIDQTSNLIDDSLGARKLGILEIIGCR